LAAYDLEIVYRPGAENPADAPSRRPEFKRAETIEEAGPSLAQVLLAGEERAKRKYGSDKRLDQDVTVGLLTRSQSGGSSREPEAPREQAKPNSRRSRMRERLALETQASQQQDAVHVLEVPISDPRQEARVATDEMSPYGKVPDALTSHLLSLQSRDA
jgi:hypothetical protein